MLILRLSRPTDLLTASVFEELFVEQLGAAVTIRQQPTDAWCRNLFGPPDHPASPGQAARRLADLLKDVDFVAPDFEATALAPLLLALRNRARLATRLLLVTHAPGAWILEWVLLDRLLAPGDVIVAPSRNARDLIEYLAPDLGRFVRVIPHPMRPLPAAAGSALSRGLVSLSRIHPAKLIHRQVEALDLLRRRGSPPATLDVAGSASQPEAEAYLRSLRAKVHRLGLDRQVRFVGPILGAVPRPSFSLVPRRC
jgi:glycosyltransferase involved in cell wall biosynthesis